MTVNPNDFEDDGTRQRLYGAQRKYHTVVVRLFLAMCLINVLFLSGISYAEYKAAEGRGTLRSCISPQGECAKEANKRSQDLIAATIVCSQRNIRTKQEAIRCMREVMAP